jgi:hypothetical protein
VTQQAVQHQDRLAVDIGGTFTDIVTRGGFAYDVG